MRREEQGKSWKEDRGKKVSFGLQGCQPTRMWSRMQMLAIEMGKQIGIAVWRQETVSGVSKGGYGG